MKKFLIITALHGNEGFSIPVIERITKKYPCDTYGYDWIIGNPKALEKNKRYIDVDLNRCAPGNKRSALYEERRAAEIIKKSRSYECIIDIHGTNANCGICSLVSIPRFANIALAFALQCERNIVWNNPASSKKGPVSQHVICPAIELECGSKNEEATAEKLEKTLRNFITSERKFTETAHMKSQWYFVCGRSKCPKDIADFKAIKYKNSTKYTFLSNEYKTNSCIVVEKINPEKLWETQI